MLTISGSRARRRGSGSNMPRAANVMGILLLIAIGIINGVVYTGTVSQRTVQIIIGMNVLISVAVIAVSFPGNLSFMNAPARLFHGKRKKALHHRPPCSESGELKKEGISAAARYAEISLN